MSANDWAGLSDDQRFLAELVATPSVSGSERAASEVFVRRAAELGLDSHIDEVNNAIATRGPADAPVHLMLLGHIDTVPGEIPVRVEDGVLHGRGSVDAKGPLAAFLAGAARAELPDGVRLTVAGAVGEESARSPGARHLLDRHRPSACIIGEPSGWDGVTLGYKGRLLLTAEARCDHHHSAGQDASAGDLIATWWRLMLGRVESFNRGRDRVFDQIQATIQSMSSGNDGMSQTARMVVGFRLPPGMPARDWSDEVSRLGAEGVEFSFEGMESAYATDLNDPVVRAIRCAIRGQGGSPRPKLKTGTADLNVVGPVWNCPIAAYGPGDSALDHTPQERLDLTEFDRSVEVLKEAIGTLAQELIAGEGVRVGGAI
ncbi:MAG: [LysW]-lysine hydrolase [Phycisphaerales bacterium JB065]